jgi:hypothetical protein
MVANLSFSQSSYPIQKVIDGDTFVILTKGQADTINSIFESQKKKIAEARIQIAYKDSVLKRRDSLLRTGSISIWQYKSLEQEYINTLMFLDYIENWIYDRAKEGAWLYYSPDSMWIEAVDLSPYSLKKNDSTGDLLFYRKEGIILPEENKKKKDTPKRGWEKEVILTNRPKIQKL